MNPYDRAVLAYSFDADSKGDSDLKVFSTKMVVSSKDYKEGTCFPCLGEIKKGERHRVERALFDGHVQNCRSCAACCEAMFLSYQEDRWEEMEARYRLGRQRAENKVASTLEGAVSP